MYNIREATKSDYDCVHKLQKQVHEIHTQERPDHYKTAQTTLDYDYFQNLIENDNARVFVLEHEKQIVAYTILSIKQPVDRPIIVPKKNVFMDDLGVDYMVRGKGIGRLLFKRALDFVKEIEASSLELAVWEFNEAAINFYEKMGMKTKMRRMEITI
jgi:ribosomal protein S18 acetylase RimI-like enzyme